jgi:hypothetical protein
MGVGVRQRVKGFEDDETEVHVDVWETADPTERPLSVLSVLDCRDLRRKGTEGSRNVGKTEEVVWLSGARRRKDMMGSREELTGYLEYSDVDGESARG